jgi:broad specificity phosphatase PhoE
VTVTAGVHHQCCDPAEDPLLRLVLLRHAQAELHGRFCGHSNPALTIEGHKEIPGMIQRLSSLPPSAIWCSDLQRAEQTGAAIAKHFGMTSRTSTGLREMNFGQWEGLTWEDVEMRFPEDARAWSRAFPHHRPGGGESFHEFRMRVVTELERLAREAEAGYTLVVTHAGFIRTAVAWVLGIADDQILGIGLDYGAATILHKARHHWTVTAINTAKFAFENSALGCEDRT